MCAGVYGARMYICICLSVCVRARARMLNDAHPPLTAPATTADVRHALAKNPPLPAPQHT